MVFKRTDLDDFLIGRNCVGFFDPPITLKSGRTGHYYINIRDAIETNEGLEKIAKFVYDFTVENGLRPHQFVGVPAGATAIGIEATKLIDYLPANSTPIAILREKPKDHGDPKDRYSVGHLIPGSHAVVVEDVSTTGASGESTIMNLQEAGVIIDNFLSVANRLEKRDEGRTVEEAYRDKYGITYSALTDITTLLPKAFEVQKPPKRVAELSEQYSIKYCSIPVKLLP